MVGSNNHTNILRLLFCVLLFIIVFLFSYLIYVVLCYIAKVMLDVHLLVLIVCHTVALPALNMQMRAGFLT